MIASKFLSIMIGFLVHIFNHRTQSQTSWGCGGSAGPTRNVVTRSACEAAYKSIHYVTIGGGILAGEKTIMANSGNCRIVVSSTGAGASMQPDVDAAFREIFDSCPQDKWNGHQ
ncbi:hypothetical protein PTTG_26493 [Puccinia triticina 1-1 BBBD Race 1]|uniref:Uncharacterized protein n=1 Tax=Puccinia triticina (isolate 1-1 / race 1 (BBBD)) TaxID=630390 RepID=A0A180GU03_PUCT1|nr:hypothetical protein PTTG_26493 [Puccinia triticina 1-1 BBBD Race 1]